jgi:hypothetical protein
MYDADTVEWCVSDSRIEQDCKCKIQILLSYVYLMTRGHCPATKRGTTFVCDDQLNKLNSTATKH